MAHQVRFRNSLIVSFVFLFFGCNTSEEEKVVVLPSFEANKIELSNNNGVIFYQNKPFTGRLLTFYTGNTDTAEISGYLNGREHGEWKKFYAANKIKEIRFFKNGQKVGALQAWWENGNKQLEYHFENDEYEGTCKEWNEKGQLSRIMNYAKGQEEGEQKWWYDGGKIKANYIIKDGRRFGLLGTKNCINVSDSVFKN